MTAFSHNLTYKPAIFFIAVLLILTEAFSVKGSPMALSESDKNISVVKGYETHNNFYSIVFRNDATNDDTLGIVCPEDISTYTDLNSCNTLISSGLDIQFSYNNIQTLSWRMDGATNAQSVSSGVNQIGSYTFNEGTTIITYFVQDIQGRSFNCSFQVVVTDNQAPLPKYPLQNITVETDENSCFAWVNWEHPTFVDNCSAESEVLWECDQDPGNDFPVGVTVVNYQLNDGMNGTSTYSFEITVVDNELPVFVAPEREKVIFGQPVPEAFTALNEFLSNGGEAYDNCDVDATSFSFIRENRTGTESPFTITRTYRISDVNGNIAEVDHHIIVEKTEITLKSGQAELTATSGNWSNTSTWGGTLPTTGDNVTIPFGVTVTVDITTALCNNITIESGGTLIISGSNILSIYGDWTNNGTFTPGTDGTVIFTGTGDATISGTTTFENLEVDKGSISTSLDVAGIVSVSSGGGLTMSSGLITIGSGNSLTLNYSSALTIPAAAGFDISGGTLTAGNFSITNNGLIRINSGTANFGTSSGNTVHTQVDGAFVVNNGTVNIAGRLENTAGGTLTPPGVNSGISISGGTVTLATAGNGLSNTGSLNVTSNGDFRFTGGTIVFQRPSTATTELDLGLVGGAGTKNISGGTFQFGNASTPSNSEFVLNTDIPLGNITSSANADLLLNSDLTITGSLSLDANTYIELNGNTLEREISGSGNYSFPIADASGNPVPVTVTINGSFGSNASIEVTTTNGDHPNNASSTHYLNQYWTVRLNDISSPTYSVTAAYQNTDIQGTETEIAAGAWTGSLPWIKDGVVNSSSNTLTISGLTGNFVNVTGITLDAPTVQINGGAVSEEICSGSSVTLFATATGDPVISYSWSPSSGLSNISISSPTASPVSTSTYTVVVTDGNGFTASDDIQVIVNPLPTASVSGDNTVCQNDPEPVITFTGASGSAPYTFYYNINGTGSYNVTSVVNTATVNVPTNSDGTETYNLVSVEDANGCSQTQTGSATVTINPLPTASISGTTIVCQDATQPDISFTGADGSAPYTFTYQINGSGSYTVTSVGNTATVSVPTNSPGTYIYSLVQVEDNNSCAQNQSGNATVEVTDPISASASIVDAISCFNGTANIQITASGGTPPYTYNFEGESPNSTGIFGGITGSVAGTDYDWSVTDANGCAAYTGTITVTEPEELTANAAVTSPILCNGTSGTVTITASGGTGTLTYTFNGISTTTGIFNNVVAGNYNWSVTDVNNCGPESGTLNVSEPSAITNLTASITSPIDCNGGTAQVTISASGGTGTLHYTFNGQTNTTGVFSNVYAGTGLSYSVTDDNGCGPLFGTIDVTEPTALSASAAITSAILCNGETAEVTITASGGTGALTYTFDGNSNGTGVFSGISAGNNYTWSVTDANGCGPVSGTLTISEPSALNASVTETTSISCFSGTAEIQINASGGTGSLSYTFDGVSNATGIFTGITAQSGIVWRVEDTNGCFVDGTYDVVEPVQLVIDAISSNSAICEGETLNLNSSASGGTGTLRYTWSGPNGYSVNNAQNPSITNATPTENGIYTLTVTDGNGCIETATTDVIVYDTPTVTAPSNQVACHNTATAAVNFSGADSYTWTNDNTAIGLAASGSGNIPSFVAVNDTNYTLVATITVTPSSNGCIGIPESFTISVNPVPEVSVINNTPILCDDGETNLVLSSNVAGTTFSWTATRTSGTTTGYSNGSGSNIQQTLSDPGFIDYEVTPTANGCVGTPVTVSVEVISSSFDLDVTITSGGSIPATVCPDYDYYLEFVGNSGSGTSGPWWNRTEYRWVTEFDWTNSNTEIGLAASGGPLSSPGSISFTTENTTNVDQTATITITPWSLFQSRTYSWWFGWGPWSSWQRLCSGDAFSTTITVHPFLAECPADIVTANDAGNCSATLTPTDPNFDCPPTTLTWNTSDGGSGSGNIGSYMFDVGTTTVTYDAEDALGNTSSCSFTVTVNDEEAPVISDCPTDFNVSMDAGECGAVISWTTPTANDNCDGVLALTRTDGTGLNSGDVFPAGTTNISYLTTDAAGNSSVCSFDITVAPDTEPPSMNCDPTTRVVCTIPGSQYVVPDNSWDAVVTENCSGIVNTSYNLTGATTGSGTSLASVGFNVGTTTVTWTSTDANTNSDNCSFDVIVNEDPLFTTDPLTQTVCLNGTLNLTVAVSGTPAPTLQWRKDGTDISGETGTTLVIDPVLAGDAAVYDVVATNSCGTITSAPATISVTSDPVFAQQPADQTDCYGESVEFIVNVANGQSPYSYSWQMRPTPADAWVAVGSDNPALTISNIGTGSNIDGAEYKVTVTDDCGNSIESSVASLTVNEVVIPVLDVQTVCQGGNVSFSVATLGTTPVSYEWQLDGNPISDGGPYSGAATPTLTISNAQVSENGTYSVSATFNISQPNDNGAGVTTCQSSFVDIGELTVDEGPDIVATPDNQIICPGSAITDIVLTNANGTPGTTYSWTRDNTTVLTGIPASGTGSIISGTISSGAPTTLQTTIFSITATANGCVSTGQAIVSVIDDQAPTVTTGSCPTDISVGADAGICGAVVSYTAPTFEDNCDGSGLAGTMVSGLASGETFPIGTTTVTYEYTDLAGNGTASCSFDVTVSDDIDPTALCLDITVQLDASGNATITPADIDNGSSDNCGTPVLSLDISTFDCTNLGANTVTLTATDSVGNTGTCTATVTVADDDNPVAISATVAQQDTLCLDDVTVIDITSAGGVGTIEYTFNGVTNGTGQFSVAAGYNYNWSVSNTLGCGTTSGSFYVEVRPDAGTPSFTAGATTLCQDAPNETYAATATNSISVSYSVSPLSAGSINASTGEMDWDAGFSGTATITATANGFCNSASEDLIVDITPTVGTPTAITVSAGTEPTCQLTNGTTTTTYSTTATDNTGFNWSISDGAAGSIDPATGVMTWADGFSGTVDIQVSANGCNGPSAQVVHAVNITPTVGTPSIPSPADETICQGSSPTSYTTLASDAIDYNWSVTGAGNTIAGTGTTGTVTWDPGFSGVATVSVTANGCNGPSAVASTTVNVLPTPVVTISADVSVCQNTAPDPEVTFTNPQTLPVTLSYNIDGGATQIIDIPASSSVSVSHSTATVGDFIYTMENVQYQSGPACDNPLSGSAMVTIRPEAPVAPGAIGGIDYVLPASTETYTIAAVPNATNYTWTVPAGWTINAGQGTTSITVTTGIAGEDGDITVIAQNDCGDSPASTLPVTINPNLAIVQHPQSQSDCYNNSVLFSVSISGGAVPITYTWQRQLPSESSFSDIVGDPDISYPVDGEMLVSNIGSASNPDGTQYRVRITDNAGSDITSDPATLTVNEVLSMSPVDLVTIICEGENASFGATTGGETPISMVWEKDGAPVADDAVISGATTTNISFTNARPSDAGEYRLSVTFPMTQPNNDPGNPDNCTITSIIYRTLVVNPLPVLAGPDEVCVGETINWTPNSGGTWISNDPAIATITADGEVTGVAAGTVTFTFTETATGCSSTTIPVTVHPLPSGEIVDNTDICVGDSTDFTVNLTGTAPWDITYTDGTTPVTITGILSSPHTVRVSPAVTSTYTLISVTDIYCNAASLTGSAVVTVHPLPTAAISGDATICFGTSTDLIIDLTGTQPWTISYTDGVTTNTVSGIATTPYLLSVTPDSTLTYTLTSVEDALCSGTSFTGSATITVDELPTATAGGSETICSNSTATVSGANATAGTILWTHDGAGSLVDETTLTPTYIADVADEGNTITLTMTVTSNNACGIATATATYTVIVDPLPIATAGGTETVCTSGSVTVSGATASHGNIMWTHNGTGTLTDNGTLTPTYTPGSGDSGSSVILMMTVSSDNACFGNVDTAGVIINVLPEAQVNQPDSQEVCNGEATALITFGTSNTIGTTTYSWTNSEPSIGLAASGTTNIIAPFTGVNAGNTPIVAIIEVTPHLTVAGVTCDGPSKTFTITVNPQPEVTAPIGLTYCNGVLSDTIALTGSPVGVVYDISGGSGIGLADVSGVSAIPPFVATEGSATLTVVPRYNGCTGLPVSFNVTVRPTPVVTISGGDVVCQNSAPPSIGMTNPMNLTVVVTYLINGSNTQTVNIPGRSNVSIAVPTNIAGIFDYELESVKYLDSDPPTCENDTISGMATIEVVALPIPTITGPTDICAETVGNVYETEGGMNNYSWVVSAGGTITAGGTSTDSTITVTWDVGGAQNISVRYNNSNGCAAATSTVYPVNVFPLPTPTITGSTSACLNAVRTYSTQPGMTDYQWIIPTGATLVSGGGLNDNSVEVVWDSIGVQTISVNYTSAEGCSAVAQTDKNITVNPLPEPTIDGDSVACAGTGGHVYTTEAGMSTYIWVVSAGGSITAGGSANSNTATIQWNTDGPQTVSISYINPTTNCEPETPFVFDVLVDPMPIPSLNGPIDVCEGSTSNVYTTDAGMTGYDWTISAGGTITGGGDGTDSVVVTWNASGAQSVSVNYQNANGCISASPTTEVVTVHTLPNPTVAGDTETCLEAVVTYSTVSGMANYNWILPAEATLIAGGTATDDEVTVSWNTTGNFSISLNYENANGCTAAVPTDLAVTVYELPSPTITGPADACSGGATTVYYTETGMTAYTWSVTGGTIVGGGNGTDSLVVVWNTSGAQTVSVNYYNVNDCPALAPTDSIVNVVDPAPPTCPADMDVCDGDAPFILAGATPAGGVYSGNGVSFTGGNYEFDPGAAGPGVHAIAYTMTNICADQCVFTITVTETPFGNDTTINICSGEPVNIPLYSTVPGAIFSWTSSAHSDISGNTDCSGSCGTMITDSLFNASELGPGSTGFQRNATYTVTVDNNGCTSDYTVTVTVEPSLTAFDLTWNSNFKEDFIEVCTGAEALSDNDIEVYWPGTTNLVADSDIDPWNPELYYSRSLSGPWIPHGSENNAHSYSEWFVDLSVNNQLGYHYFVIRIERNGCVQYSNPAILNVVSNLSVEAGDPDYVCDGTAVQLDGAYVSGLSGTVEGVWSIESLNPANADDGDLSDYGSIPDPDNVTYTPPAGYYGEITLALKTNTSGACDDILDTRTITVAPPSSFNGCLQLADWSLSGTNSNGYLDDSEEPCVLTLVGSDDPTHAGSAGTTDLTHCTGDGTVSFDWAFLAPANHIIWHKEDQKESTGLTVSAPDNISAGDLIIVTIHVNDNNLSFSGSGFTEIVTATHSTRIATVASFYKIATAGEPASYSFSVSGGSVGSDDRILATRVTGHDQSNPIGAFTNSNTAAWADNDPTSDYRTITVPGVSASSNAMLVAALAVEIGGASVLEFSNAPLGMTTVYYNDNETSSRVATDIVSGNTGNRSFQWPSYNSRNRDDMDAAAILFTINPETDEEDAAYFMLNGTPTFLSNTTETSGSRSIPVSSGDNFGFRVGTSSNTGGPGRLIIYNLELPNDIPVVIGADSIFITDCQLDTYTPTFEDLTVIDSCDSPVLSFDSLGTVDSDGCQRSQSYTRVYIDDCGAESEPFTQTVVWQVAEPIFISCPTDPMLEACTEEDTVIARYNEWVAGFTASGGCDLTTNIFEIPPLVLSNIACGDTLSFTYQVTDGCGQDTSCTSTFTVQPLDTLIIYAPADTVLAGCTDADSIRMAYTNWLAAFDYDGGCAAVTTNIGDTMPLPADPSCGVMLEFTYIVSNECGQFESEYASFVVDPPEPIAITVPAGVSLPLCSNISDIDTAYNNWVAGFTHTGGCNVISNIDSIPALGDISCGGTLNFTYSVQNANSACSDLHEGTSFFSVAEAPNLIISCPPDTTIAGCMGIQAITDAYDTWVDGFRATGGCAITTNIDSIPPLGGLICNGSITFTFIVGNDSTLCTAQDSCTSTFTIGAAPLLSVITPSDTIVTGCNTDSTVIDAFNTWKSQFTYTGGCDGYVSSSDISAYDLPGSCGGSVTVIYSAWDDCSQFVTDSATFTINPDLISVNAPLDEVQAACQTQAEIDSAFADWKSRFGFTGGCGTVGTDLSSIVAPDACGGTIVVNFSAQDVCGQVQNTSAIFTIDLPSSVLQEPTFDIPADITIYRDDTCSYNADTLITGVPVNVTDNCTAAGNLTVVYADSVAAGSCASELIIYRQWTVLDNCLNATSQTQIITVRDTTPPVVVCAADVINTTDPDECEATGVDIGTTTATDNCLLASFDGIRSDGLLITDPYPVGITTITWTATDACGNVDTCNQTVTIEDYQPPVVVCPADVDHDADPGLCYRTNVVITDPTADDNCMLSAVIWVMTGATTGNSPATGINYVGGETFNVGVTTVIYYAVDAYGNTDSCSFTVTIHDITPPNITANCVDASDFADPDMCSKVPATLSDPVYSDDCWPNDSLVVTWVMTGATTGSGFGFVTDSSFNVGVTTVTYTVTDPDGNFDECTFNVTILDVTPPVITAGCSADVSETAAPDSCSKVPATLEDPDYFDTCWPKDSLVLTYEITGANTGSGTGTVSGVSFNVGTSTVTYTVTDPDGNDAQCSFNVTIIDVTDPVIEITDCVDVSDVAAPDSCSKVPGTLTDPDYSDTCWPKDSLVLSYTITGATTGSGIGSVIGTSFNVGVSTVFYTVTDPDGNTDDCSFDVTIIDVTPPNIDIAGCQDVSDTTDMGNCTVIPAEIQDPVYSDDCWPVDSLNIVWEMSGATVGNGTGSVRGETFNTGITTVVYTVSDPDGNEDSCSFTVTILPFDMPAFTTGCPPDVSADNDPLVCGADLVIPVPTVDDPCLLGYTITNDRTGTDNASGYYPVDTTYVVWTITPALGDPSTCTQMVIVRDVEDPVIVVCPIDQNIEGCDSSAATLSPAFSNTLAETDYATFSDITNQGDATDNCGIVRVTYIDVAAGVCPMVITRTWTVYDAAGNSASCDQTITIDESEPPVAICPPNLETPSDFDSVFAMFVIPSFPYSDNCTDSADIAVSWTITGTTVGSGTGLIPTPYRFNRGLSTVEYTFVDACGNPSTCSFTVFVHYPPDITCPPPLTLCNDTGNCSNYIEPLDIDNPGIPTDTTGEALDWTWTVYAPDGTTVLGTGTSTGITPDPIGPVDFPIGTSTIHWYAENLSGHDECDQLFTVADCEAPTATPTPWEDCVDPINTAIYHGDVDNLELNPDYPVADYHLFEYGNTSLDLDLSTYSDNCCVLADGYSLRWEIDFDGSETAIVGTGQPSTYVDSVFGNPADFYLWGDGVNFQSRMHTITYWITDCNGNESAPIQTTITVKPRPELIKVTN